MEFFSNNIDLGILCETFFLMPFRLRIDDIDVFGYTHIKTHKVQNWISLPLLSVVIDWGDKLIKLPFENKQIIYLADFGEALLEFKKNKIFLKASINSKWIEADYDEFYKAYKTVSASIIQDLNKSVPNLFSHLALKRFLESPPLDSLFR